MTSGRAHHQSYSDLGQALKADKMLHLVSPGLPPAWDSQHGTLLIVLCVMYGHSMHCLNHVCLHAAAREIA